MEREHYTILVISPHPDDETIGCGGTLLTHIHAGDHVRVIFLTAGEMGGHGRSVEETRELRQQEALAAAKVLGITDIEFWHLPDGQLTSTDALAERCADEIEHAKASIVYVPNGDELHPDHRAAADIVRNSKGILARRTQSLPEFRMYEVWTPVRTADVIIDITAHIETKRRAIGCYDSQCAEVAFDEAIIGLNRYRGELYSWPEGDYAEVFELMG